MSDHRDTDLDDPEDAFDATDPPKVRLLNFARRLNWVIDHLDDLDEPRVQDEMQRLERLRDDIDKLRSQLTE